MWSMLSSLVINAGCMIAGGYYHHFVSSNYRAFAFLWVVEAVFLVELIIIGAIVKWKIRYYVFLGGTGILAVALYVVNIIGTAAYQTPPRVSTVWLVVGVVELAAWKQVFATRFASSQAISLGLGILASQCIAEFVFSVDIKDLLSLHTLYLSGWIVVAIVACALHWVWEWKNSLLDLKLDEIPYGEQAPLLGGLGIPRPKAL